MRSEQPVLDQVQTGTHNIPLTAVLQGGNVVIQGDRSTKSLPKGDPSCRFNFTLTDNTGLGVKFMSLDAQDNWSNCPPPGGENSTQIVGVTIAPDGLSAGFTDNNSNQGQMDVCYQWNFTCNDPSKLPITFDPIISNGGKV